MGTIVKSHVAEALGVAPDALFHASVMPCFDKKLEASRADFSRDVAVPEGGGRPRRGDGLRADHR